MRRIAVVAAVALCFGCSGPYVMLTDVDPNPVEYEVLGEAEGRASGWLVLHFIPIAMTTPMQRAIAQAVESRRGDDLANIRVQERWYFTPLWTGHGVRVRGDVVKRRSATETARLQAEVTRECDCQEEIEQLLRDRLEADGER